MVTDASAALLIFSICFLTSVGVVIGEGKSLIELTGVWVEEGAVLARGREDLHWAAKWLSLWQC